VNLDRTQASELAQLMFVWDREYTLACDGDTWSARPHAARAEILTAGSAAELRELLREDAQHRRRAAAGLLGPSSRAHTEGTFWCGQRHSLLQAQELNEPGCFLNAHPRVRRAG
jgi:hypothetical protein